MLIEQNLSENSLFRFHFQTVISHEKDEVVREKLSFTEPSAHSGKHPNLVTPHSTGYSYSILTYQSYNISNCWMETLFMERKINFSNLMGYDWLANGHTGWRGETFSEVTSQDEEGK